MPEDDDVSMPEEEFVKPKSYFARLGGVYVSPGAAFGEIGRDPRLGIPIVVLIVIGFLLGFFLSTHIDIESLLQQQQSTAQSPLSPERIASLVKGMIILVTGVGSILFALVVAAVVLLISKIVNAENSYSALLAVTVYSNTAITIVSGVLLVLIITLKGSGELDPRNISSALSSSLGAILAKLFGEDFLPKYFMKLLNYVDFFQIWRIVLLAIGYSAVSRKLKTATIAAWLVGLYAILALIGAAVGSLRG
jgi:hypothetical protein